MIEGRHDLAVDVKTNSMVYLDPEDHGSLVVEYLLDRKLYDIPVSIDCSAAFVGSCIDTISLVDQQLFVTWTESSDEQGKPLKRTHRQRVGP